MSSDADNRRGAGLMMASMAAFTINDTFVKLAAGSLSLGQILVLRGVVAIVILMFLARRFQALRRIPARDMRLVGIRSAAEIGAAYFFLTALLAMPIANVTAILQSLPLTVTLCAALFLGEHVGWRRWSAIAAGFLGMLLITRPGTEDFTLASIYALIAVGFVTLRDLTTRRMSVAVPSLLVTLSAAVAVTLFAGGLAAVQGWTPLDLRTGLMVLGSGLFITAGYFLSVAAMRVGDVGAVSPFRYSGLVWALVLGWFVFGEWPETLTFIGAGIIAGAGIFTLRRGRAIRAQTQAQGFACGVEQGQRMRLYMFLLAGIVEAVMAAQIHRRIVEGDGRHVQIDLLMAEIHHALAHAALHRQRLRDAPVRMDHRLGGEPARIGAGEVAAVPVEAHQPVRRHKGGAIGRRPAQGRDEAHGHGVIVVMAELQAGGRWVVPVGKDDILTDLAMRPGRVRFDHDLRHIGDHGVEPRAGVPGQAVAHEDDEGEIRVGLAGDRRQADGLEQA